MGNGPGQILGSRVDGATGEYYMIDVTPEGAIPISGTIGIIGSITIGSVSAHVDSIYVQSGANLTGSVYVWDSVPTAGIKNNPKWAFEYDADGNIGSVYQMIGTGSYVNTLVWEGYSGALPGLGSRVTNISEWSAV